MFIRRAVFSLSALLAVVLAASFLRAEPPCSGYSLPSYTPLSDCEPAGACCTTCDNQYQTALAACEAQHAIDWCACNGNAQCQKTADGDFFDCIADADFLFIVCEANCLPRRPEAERLDRLLVALERLFE